MAGASSRRRPIWRWARRLAPVRYTISFGSHLHPFRRHTRKHTPLDERAENPFSDENKGKCDRQNPDIANPCRPAYCGDGRHDNEGPARDPKEGNVAFQFHVL